MKPFYLDKEAEERAKSYIGKTMGEIVSLEQKAFEEKMPKIDEAHAAYASDRSSGMLKTMMP